MANKFNTGFVEVFDDAGARYMLSYAVLSERAGHSRIVLGVMRRNGVLITDYDPRIAIYLKLVEAAYRKEGFLK